MSMPNSLAKLYGYLPVAGLALAIVMGLVLAVANFRAERDLLHSARFICLINKGKFAGERLWLNLRDDSFDSTLGSYTIEVVQRVSEDPFEAVAFSTRGAWAGFEFRIREEDGAFALFGQTAEDAFWGRCHLG